MIEGGSTLGRAVAIAALALSPVHADEQEILARDDTAFARALARNGYPDLAEEVLATVEKAGRSKDEVLLVEAVRLELRQLAVEAEPDPLKQGELYESIGADMERFVEEHPGTDAAADISDRLLEIYRTFGERVAARLRSGEADADPKELREVGEKMFTRAITGLKSRRERIQMMREAHKGEPDPALEYEAMLADYDLIRTYYFRSLLVEEANAKAIRIQNALDLLTDFQLDYSGQLLCYEGFIYEGLCYRDLGQPDAAIESFDYAIRVRETFEVDEKGQYLLPIEAADLVSAGVLQKMLVLLDRNEAETAAAVAQDFFDTIPQARGALKTLAILEQQSRALAALGDEKGSQAAAQAMVDLDPSGPGGERGRELLGSGGGASLGGADVLELAQAAARRNDAERAIALCQQSLVQLRGTSDEAELGSSALLLLGALYARKGEMHEASVAWSAATGRYAKSHDAPECLWRAANGYLALQEQERSTYYRDRARETMTQLSSEHPDHAYASMAAIIEGQQLEAEQRFQEAADVYARIPAGNAGHEEGLYRAGNALYRLVNQLAEQGKTTEARERAAEAERKLREARPALEAAAEATLDSTLQERLRGYAFASRVSLGNLYLTKVVDRPGDVEALMDDVERQYPGDASKIAAASALRLRSLQAQGSIDEAMSVVDAQLRADPSGKSLGGSVATLARALDERGNSLAASDKGGAERAWRKAAEYYQLAIRGQLSGERAVRVDELEPVANRLFALALLFNGVPEDVESFVEWKETRFDPTLLEVVVRAYQTLLPLTPSYRTQISLGRALGFLQRWDEAAQSYADLFEFEPLANLTTRTIDAEVLQQKPELAFALLEWGACERELGLRGADLERLSRASSIFESLVLGTRADTKLWWAAKYYQVQTLTDRGEYEIAKVAMRDLERNYPDLGAGGPVLAERFRRLSAELQRK